MRLFPVVLVLVAAGNLAALAPGDDVAAYWKAKASLYQSTRTLETKDLVPGWETAVSATDAGFSRPPFILVLRKVAGVSASIPFGTVEGPNTLILDTDGDGILDFSTSRNVVPGWLALHLPGPRGDTKAFRALTDRMYRQYNQAQGPVSAQLALLVDDLRRQAVDAKNLDRDLAAALLFALEEGAAEPEVGAGTLAALGQALKNRGGPSSLVLLFLGEALEASGRPLEAQASYNQLIVVDPKSVIGAYKKAQPDAVSLAAFRKLHPDFWAARR